MTLWMLLIYFIDNPSSLNLSLISTIYFLFCFCYIILLLSLTFPPFLFTHSFSWVFYSLNKFVFLLSLLWFLFEYKLRVLLIVFLLLSLCSDWLSAINCNFFLQPFSGLSLCLFYLLSFIVNTSLCFSFDLDID